MKKKKSKGEPKAHKIKRRREGKRRMYSRRMNIKVPKYVDDNLKTTYNELYLEARKMGVDVILLEKINLYDYERDVKVLGNRIDPLMVEVHLLKLAMAIVEHKGLELSPLDVLKYGEASPQLLDALDINSLWLDFKELFKCGKFTSRGYEELQALKGL